MVSNAEVKYERKQRDRTMGTVHQPLGENEGKTYLYVCLCLIETLEG